MLTEQQIIGAIGVMLKVWRKIKVFYPLFRYFKRMVCDVRGYSIYIMRWEKGYYMARVWMLHRNIHTLVRFSRGFDLHLCGGI